MLCVYWEVDMTVPITIGVITPFVDGDYFGPLVVGIQQVTQQRGAKLLVYRGVPGDLESSRLATKQVQGWIAAARISGIRTVVPPGTPLVVIAARPPDDQTPVVEPDNFTGMQETVAHLIAHGHRRIAFLGNPQNDEVRQRFAGYQAALSAAGIALEPDLEMMVASNQEEGGRDGGRRLLQAGLSCTALATATDDLAIGAMEVFAAAGKRVPEDIAIASFDDIDRALYLRPPLTTVRQQPQSLGELAANSLLDHLAGQSVPLTLLVPTTLVVRESCGCPSGAHIKAQALLTDTASAQRSWQETLARRLALLIRFPLPVDPAADPASIWPGVGTLIAGLTAAMDEAPPPASALLERVWQEAVERTQSVEMLQAMIEAIEQTAQTLLTASSDATRSRVNIWIRTMQAMMFHARLTHEAARGQFLAGVVHHTSSLSLDLLGAKPGVARSLNWLSHTTVSYATLALWSGDDHQTVRVVGQYGKPILHYGDAPIPAPAFPPLDLYMPEASPSHETILLMPVRSIERDWGILLLRTPLENALVVGNVLLWTQLLAAALERDALLESLEEQQRTLQAAYERERSLALTVRELGSPVVPVLPGVLLVPLVGMIDAERAFHLIEAVLSAVSQQHAAVVVLDMTSVPVVDTVVADALMKMERATTLLGTRVILVGIRPEIAQSIANLGIDLRHLSTYASLASALAVLSRHSALS
jgi:DNA-binding LacI/PurR family transcriptional regulator/anti-anti-sigma regulatory factor